MDSKIKLYVRTRPTAETYTENVKIEDNKTIQIMKAGRLFELKTDGIYENSTQNDFYSLITRLQVIKNVLNGYNSIIMCYGTFMSGKTYTLTGSQEIYKERGLIPRFITELFHKLNSLKQTHEVAVVTVKISAIQIHGDTVFDLLRPQGITETNLNDILSHVARDEEDALCLLFLAEKQKLLFKEKRRKNGFANTWVNFIFQIEVEIKTAVLVHEYVQKGKLKFVNIAGCVGALHDPVTKEELIAREMFAIWENDIRIRTYSKVSYKPRCHRCKLAYLLRDTISSQFIVILTIWVTKELLPHVLATIQFGQRLLQLPRIVGQADIRNFETDIITKLHKELEQLKAELETYQLLYRRNRPINHLKPRDSELRELFNSVTLFMEDQRQTIDISSGAEANAAFEMMKNVYKSIKDETIMRQKYRIAEIDSINDIASDEILQVVSEPFSVLQGERDVKSGGNLDLTEGFSVGDGLKAESKLNAYVAGYKMRRMTMRGHSLASFIKSRSMHTEMESTSRVSDSTPPVQLPPRAEAFEYFKNQVIPDLAKHLRDFKARKMYKKNRINNILKEIKRCNEREIQIRPSTINLLRGSEDMNDPAEELSKLNWKKRNLLTELFGLNQALGKLVKLMHEARVRIMREFDSWYERKYQVLLFQSKFQDPEYIRHSEASKARQDHRKVCERHISLPQAEIIFHKAERRVVKWIIHSSKRRRTKAKITELTFDFLQKVETD